MIYNLYDKIYDVAERNMKSDHQQFSYSKMAFHAIIGVNPEEVNCEDLSQYTNHNFFVAIYLRTLNRLPDPGSYHVYEMYHKLCDGEPALFQYFVLRYIEKSSEFRKLHKTLIYGSTELLFYKVFRRYGKKIIRVYLYEYQMRVQDILLSLIRPVWAILPNSIKNVIRELLGREKK